MKIKQRTSKTLIARTIASKYNVSRDLWESVSNPTPPVGEVSYVLKNTAYNYAEMTSEVVIPDDGIFSFYIIPSESSGVDYILKSLTTPAYVYYRQSDGRLRLKTDDDQTFTFNLAGLPLNTPTKIAIRLLSPNGLELYVNDVYISTPLGPHTTFTVGSIGEGVTTFGVTLGNLASYPMRSSTVGGVNSGDMIGSNDLTYLEISDPLSESNYKEVRGDY